MALSITKKVGRDERTATAVAAAGALLGVAAVVSAVTSGVGVVVVVAAVLAAVLLGLGWRGRRVARRLVPQIARHSSVTIDAAEVKAAADAGEPFALPLGDRTVDVRVDPAPVGPDGTAGTLAEVAEDDAEPTVEERVVESVVTYAGGLAEAPEGSDVRLTVTDEVVTGYVAAPDGFWYVEPRSRFDADAAPDEYVVYRRRDLDFAHDVSDDVRRPETVEPAPDSDNSVNPTVPIVVVADPEYDREAGFTSLSWYEQQANLVNQVNGVFGSDLGVRFEVQWYILDLRSGSLSSTDPDRLLDQMEDPVRVVVGDIRQASVRQSENVEVAHLTTGKDLDGDTIGVAYNPGAHGLSEQTLAVIRGGGGFGSSNIGYENMMVAVHELGHNFDADHDEAAKWCVTHVVVCWDFERTVMWDTFHDDNHDDFSNGSRQSGKDNESVIRNHMRNGRSGNFWY